MPEGDQALALWLVVREAVGGALLSIPRCRDVNSDPSSLRAHFLRTRCKGLGCGKDEAL